MRNERKTIVLTDFMLVRGGAERVALELAGFLATTLYAAFIDKKHFPELLNKPHFVSLGSHSARAGWQLIKAWRLYSQQGPRLLAPAQTVIYNGSYCLAAASKHTELRNILYCHTPPRFIYDLREYYLREAALWQKPLLLKLINYIQPRYEAALQYMDIIVANSENVKNRIDYYLGKNAQVIYPPCDISAYHWIDQGDYYLSTARLEPYKRVELIVRAFMKLRDKKLVVASGGSELPFLQSLAQGFDNIIFTGWLEESTLRTLIGKAIATLYLPINEDFGMSPVESMAAGKPVIGVAEGGLLETVRHGETGTLLLVPLSLESLIDAILQMTPRQARQMREACSHRAALFSREIFRDKMLSVVGRG